ncbi:unnamed protein product [Microthlaspi erraticum]|uniref:Uncharacterized protein n=1 Tax=Microthlaspi erraticum TaxID=1685480 RepID=A0A6D2JU66_9BRAS|nr:unnamed protein product [Microthlaspi erraticum]
MYMMRKNEMRMNETVQNGTRRKREGINRTGHNEAKIIPDKAERDGKKEEMGWGNTRREKTERGLNGRDKTGHDGKKRKERDETGQNGMEQSQT